jgi:hypothetical protein
MSTTVRVVVCAQWTAFRALWWSMRMLGTRWLLSVLGRLLNKVIVPNERRAA